MSTQKDPDNIDLEKFISDSTTEIKKGDEKESEKKKKMELLTKAIESKTNMEPLVFNNAETEEFIGTKLRYVKDEDGKTVYDYMNDPVVSEHIEWVVPEEDPRDGSPVEQQVSFFWKKPTF